MWQVRTVVALASAARPAMAANLINPTEVRFPKKAYLF